MAMAVTKAVGIGWGEFSDASAEQRYLDARGAAPNRGSRAALWSIAIPSALASGLDWMLISGTTWKVVACARFLLVMALVVGGLLCGRVRSSAQLAATYSLAVVVALAAYTTIAACYHLQRGRSDFGVILSLAAAVLLTVHPGAPRRAALLLPAFLSSAVAIAIFTDVAWSTAAWNLVTIASALGCGLAGSFVLNTHGRATYAVNERLARSEAELRRLHQAEARSAQRALARREDAWQALVASAPVLVLIADVSGCVTFVNRAAEQVGFGLGSSLGGVFSLLPDVDESHAASGSDPLTAILSCGEHAQFDARIHVGESFRRYHCHVAPIGEARPHSEVVVIAVDVTQSHELSEQLHAAQKQQTMGGLAAGVAHDINNLLSVILAAAELSTMAKGIDERTRENLESIQSAVARASRLTRQLLMFASRRPSALESVDVNVALSDLDVLFRRLLGVDIQIVYELDPNLPPARIDQSHLEQVLLNLVTNARDAMGSGGSLRITTRRTDDGVTIALKDNGCGMSDEVRARILEPFYTTKGARGTGIGLATVARAIDRFGGHLDVRSTLNVGTEVTIWLQVATKGPVMASALAAPVVSGCRVLLVDDEPEVLCLAAAMLAQRGYQTQQARSFDEACARLTAFEPEVLITDVRLPGLPGREIAAKLRARRPQLAVVFMSGCVDDPVLLEAVEAGEELLLDKPFTSQELVSMIERARARQLHLDATWLKPSA